LTEKVLYIDICKADLPIAKTVASDYSIDVLVTVVTNSSPCAVVIDFQTSVVWWRPVYQPHCRHWCRRWCLQRFITHTTRSQAVARI